MVIRLRLGYQVRLPMWRLQPNRAQVGMQGNALLAIQTTPFQAPPDPPWSPGAALAWVEVIADQGLAIPSLPAVQQVLLPLMPAVLATTFASWRWKFSQTVRLLATLLAAAISRSAPLASPRLAKGTGLATGSRALGRDASARRAHVFSDCSVPPCSAQDCKIPKPFGWHGWLQAFCC